MYRPKNIFTNVLRFALLTAASGCAPAGETDASQSAQPIVHCRYGSGATEAPYRASGLVQCVPVNALHCPPAPGGGPNADDCTPVIDVFDRLPTRFEFAPLELPWVEVYSGPRFCDVRIDGCGPFWLRPEVLGPNVLRGAASGRSWSTVTAQGEHPAWVDAVREQIRASGRDAGLGGEGL